KIQASSGLNEEEVKRMVQDAKAHAAEDRKFHELVNARNQADNLIHAVSKTVKEVGDKLPADEKQAIEKALDTLKEAVKTENKDDIEAKTKALTDASAKMSERLYAEGGKGGGGEDQGSGGTGGTQAGGAAQGEKPADNVVDAEFEEVKDD